MITMNVSDGITDYSHISKWVHFGRSVNTCHARKCISAVIVIDYLYRDAVVPLQKMSVPHPLSVIFSTLSMETIVWSANDLSRVEDAYRRAVATQKATHPVISAKLISRVQTSRTTIIIPNTLGFWQYSPKSITKSCVTLLECTFTCSKSRHTIPIRWTSQYL